MIDERQLITELELEIGETYNSDICYGLKRAIEIVEHRPLVGKWIPCSERLPENETCVLATVWHKSWIADYDSGNEEWWTEHPERYEVCMVYRDGNKYKKLDDADYDNINYIPVAPQEDNLAYPIEVVVAWQPLPAPYQPEGKVE